MFNELVKQIKNLPPLPLSVTKVQAICDEAEVNMTALVDVIENDAMLNASIIKMANSPLYGMSKEVASVRHAIMLFGVNIVRGFVAAIAIRRTLPIDLTPYNINIEELSSVSTMQAGVVRQWYFQVDKAEMQKLQSAALLMELGKIIIAKKLMLAHMFQRFEDGIKDGDDVSELERSLLGINSYEATALMLEHWNFEEELIEILRFVGRSDQAPSHIKTLVQALEVVKTVVNIQENFSEESISKALSLVNDYGLDSKSFMIAIEALRQE